MENSTDLLWQKALEDRQNGTLDSIPQNLDCLSTQLSLIAVFVYDVDKGGFAQYVYNSKGLYLGETLDLFHIPKAANAAKHLGEVIEHCLTNEEAYQVFLSSNYDASDFKNTLHSISFQYFKSDLSLRTTA